MEHIPSEIIGVIVTYAVTSYGGLTRFASAQVNKQWSTACATVPQNIFIPKRDDFGRELDSSPSEAQLEWFMSAPLPKEIKRRCILAEWHLRYNRPVKHMISDFSEADRRRLVAFMGAYCSAEAMHFAPTGWAGWVFRAAMDHSNMPVLSTFSDMVRMYHMMHDDPVVALWITKTNQNDEDVEFLLGRHYYLSAVAVMPYYKPRGGMIQRMHNVPAFVAEKVAATYTREQLSGLTIHRCAYLDSPGDKILMRAGCVFTSAGFMDRVFSDCE